jgi:adenylate cyclase
MFDIDTSKKVWHSRFISLLSELKERKVLRVALAYIVVIWIVVQVGEATFEALKLPEWSLSLLVIFSLLGFPIALVLAWAYEITPDGVVEDMDGNPGSHFGAQKSRYGRDRINGENTSASIAVLLFEDMSIGQDQSYFCEGIAEQILCALSDVDGLCVAARVASFQFGGKSADILEIGKRLNVSVVLEGSVRKSGNQIRTTTQLINTHDGYQFWTGEYNHDLADIFDVQEKIAMAVVSAMRLTIGDKLLIPRITESTEAYDIYLKGSSYLTQPDKQDILFARQLFKQAVEIDPGFGRAWAKLASTYAYEYVCTKANDRARSEARRISIKALQLAPDIAESHIARGIAYAIDLDYGQADLEFTAAVNLNAASFNAWLTWARCKTYQGEARKAVEYYQKASEISPEDYQSVLMQVAFLEALGDSKGAKKKSKEGLRKAREFLKLNPDEIRAWSLGAFALQRLGKRSEAKKWMEFSLLNSPRNSILTSNAASFYALIGDTNRSLDYVEQAANCGCLNLGWMKHDSNLDKVRVEPRFKAIIAQYKAPPEKQIESKPKKHTSH